MENQNSNVNNGIINEVEVNFDEINKKTNTKNIIAISAIVVLFLILLFVTFSYFNSPKKRMVDSINKFFNVLISKESNPKINNILKNNIVGLEGETTFSLNGDIVGESSGPLSDTAGLMLNSLGNTVIKYNYVEDKKNKIASLDLDSSINNEKLIEMYGLMKDDKFYFNLKNLIDKYYYMDYIFTGLLTVGGTADAEYIVNILKDTIIESLDNDDFAKEKDSIKIDGESKKVEKISFKFTDKYIIDVMADFAKKIKDDSKALNILVEYNNLTKEEVLETLNTVIDSAEEITTSSQDFVFNMYVKDYFTTVKYELVIDTMKISYYNYKDTKEFSISDNGIKYFDVEVKNNKDISGTLAMMIPFEGTYEDGNLNLTITYMTMKCNLVINTEEKYKTDSYNSNVNFEFKIADEDKEYLNLSMSSKNTISKKDKINELDVSSSTSVDDITESDQLTIINKLSEMTIFKEIMEITKENQNLDSNVGNEFWETDNNNTLDTNNTYDGILMYDTSINMSNEFSISVPNVFDNDSNNYKYDYEYKSGNGVFDSCEIVLKVPMGYSSADNLINEMANYYEADNPTEVTSTTINNIKWHWFSYDGGFGKTYYYGTTKNNKVYLFEYNVQEDAASDCENYRQQILNSIKQK